ncbi:hypothetical protein [Nocardia beijingensis]|uniref:hypothetical protein n=1 Tax=Nocardia beijingensis TaxID=95162 RepID=UPI000836B9AC|nr:hypothetical protein [Nocardia beijingensis]
MRIIIGTLGALTAAAGLITAAPAAHAGTNHRVTPTAITRIGDGQARVTVDYQCPPNWTTDPQRPYVDGIQAFALANAPSNLRVEGANQMKLTCDRSPHTTTVTISATRGQLTPAAAGTLMTVTAAFYRVGPRGGVIPGDTVHGMKLT